MYGTHILNKYIGVQLMNVQNELNKISDRVFNGDYNQFLLNWMVEQEMDPYFGEIVADYLKATEFLAQCLDKTQSGELAGLENLFRERQIYAARHCFSCGLYGAFEQFFGDKGTDDYAFHRLVEDGLMTMPGMERHIGPHVLCFAAETSAFGIDVYLWENAFIAGLVQLIHFDCDDVL